MSLPAYVKDGTKPQSRPVIFVFNGESGSATAWLHMGALSPRSVAATDAQHTSPMPWRLLDNDTSSLDAPDVVFTADNATCTG